MTARSTKTGRHARRADHVSATELAEMGFCEKRVLLAHLHGEQAGPMQREHIRRGRLAHQQYHQQGLRAGPRDSRCFVATCVFGESAPQTAALRDFRDTVLLPCWWGRPIVFVYYRTAPAACVVLRLSPALQTVVRGLLGFLVARLERGSVTRSQM